MNEDKELLNKILSGEIKISVEHKKALYKERFRLNNEIARLLVEKSQKGILFGVINQMDLTHCKNMQSTIERFIWKVDRLKESNN